MTTDPFGPADQALGDGLTCRQVTDAIIEYLTGGMQPETTVLFNDHLQGCPDCAAFFKTYNSTIRVTRSLSYDEIPDTMRTRVRQFLLKTIADK